MQSFDPISLQRLIDGELDRDETRKMLEMAQANPELWRDMASAFVENQIWLGDFVELNLNHDAAQTSPPQPPVKPPQKASSLDQFNRFNWFSLAAGILIALSGIWIASQFSQPTNIASNPGTESIVAAVSDEPLNGKPSLQPEYSRAVDTEPLQLELEDQYGNSVLESEVPLYDYETAAKKGFVFGKQSEIPREVVQHYRRGGYDMNQATNYVSGRLSDGRMFVVPVRTIQFQAGQ